MQSGRLYGGSGSGRRGQKMRRKASTFPQRAERKRENGFRAQSAWRYHADRYGRIPAHRLYLESLAPGLGGLSRRRHSLRDRFCDHAGGLRQKVKSEKKTASAFHVRIRGAKAPPGTSGGAFRKRRERRGQGCGEFRKRQGDALRKEASAGDLTKFSQYDTIMSNSRGCFSIVSDILWK